jgi:hypothetical protein
VVAAIQKGIVYSQGTEDMDLEEVDLRHFVNFDVAEVCICLQTGIGVLFMDDFKITLRI